MFRSILIPLDGSAFSESALPWALALGKGSQATLHLASVHEPIPTFAHDEWDAAASEWTDDYLGQVRDRLLPKAEGGVDGWVGRGPVVERLLERANEVSADLVVMATHGRGGLTRAWLGSTADAFLRQSGIPILLVRPSDEASGGADSESPRVERIMVPLDGSDLSVAVLEMAAQLAELWGATLHLVRVVAYPVEIASPYLPHTVQMNQEVIENARKSAQTYLEERAGELRGRGLDVKTLAVVDTQAAHALVREVERLDADLVVMATHGRGGIQRALLGSTTDKVVRSVQVPVLVSRPE